MTATKPSKSQLFKAYWAAKRSGKVDAGRLNRALGIAQSKRWEWDGTDMLITGAKGETYHVNGTCDCRDYTHRRIELCKHRTARYLVMRAATL